MASEAHDLAYPDQPVPIAVIQHDEREFAFLQKMLERLAAPQYIVNRACSFDDGLSLLMRKDYGLALIDDTLGSASGLDIIQRIGGRGANTPIIVLTNNPSRETDIRAMRAGAMDFIDLTSLSLDRLERSIRYVRDVKRTMNRLRVCSGLGHLAEENKANAADLIAQIDYKTLTDRENEILAHVASGASSKLVAGRLGISPRTVEVHRARIMKKLNVKNATSLVRLALADNSAI